MCISMLSLYSHIIEDRILAVLDVSAVERQECGMLPVLQLGSVLCVVYMLCIVCQYKVIQYNIVLLVHCAVS